MSRDESAGESPRILFALASAEPGRALIDAVTELGAVFRAECRGILGHDPDLLDLAEMPFARAITLGGAVRTFDRRVMERALADERRRLDAMLALAAGRLGLTVSLEARPGRIEDSVEAELRPGDILVLSATPARRPDPAGWSRVEQLVARSRGLMFVPPEPAPSRAIVALADGEASRATIATAARIAAMPGHVLHVVALTADEAALTRIRESAAATGVTARVHRAGTAGPEELESLLVRLRPRVVIAQSATLARLGLPGPGVLCRGGVCVLFVPPERATSAPGADRT